MIGDKHPDEGTFRMPVCHCPHCGYKLDAASVPGNKGKRPIPGDFSVCLKCAAVLRFKDDLTLRATTLGEHKECEPGLLDKMIHAIHYMKKLDPNWCKRTSS